MVSMKSVKDTIGIPNPNSLSRLCALPEKGGSGGYAYYVKENSITSSGNLVENSLPYHNIYSRNSPAEWRAQGSSDYVRNRLKRDSADHYHYSLGEFSGYNHSSSAPTHVNAEVTSGISSSNHYMKGNFNAHLGSIDWRILNTEGTLKAARVKLIVYSSTYDFSLECGSSSFIELKGLDSITFTDTEYYVDASSAGSKDYRTRIALYSSNNIRMGFLPGSGKINVTIKGKVKDIKIIMEAKDYGSWLREIYIVTDTSSSLNRESKTVFSTFSYNSSMDHSKIFRKLTKVSLYVYEPGNSRPIYGQEITGLDNAEGFFPKSLLGDPGKYEIGAPVMLGELPSTGRYLEVIFYYE